MSCWITRRRSLLVFPCMGTKVQKTPWCTGPIVISELVRHLEVNSWKDNLPAAFRSQFSFSMILFFSCTSSHNGTYTEQISSYSDERSRKELHAPRATTQAEFKECRERLDTRKSSVTGEITGEFLGTSLAHPRNRICLIAATTAATSRTKSNQTKFVRLVAAKEFCC